MAPAARSPLKTLLIPVDGSPQAEEAVRSVQAFSPPERVLLLYCLTIPQMAYPGTGMSVGQDFSAAAEKSLKQEGLRILEKAAALLPPECGQISQLLEIGTPASVILSMAQQHAADFILMGSRGLGAIREYVIGSVSYRIAGHAPCPVLLIKAPVVPLTSILFPVEHPQDAEWAMEFLSQKPFQNAPRISVLHVVPFTQPVLPVTALLPDSWEKELEAGARRLTQEVADKLSHWDYPVECLVERGAPSSIIQEQISQIQPQIVLMGTPNRSPLQRLVQGSITHATLHHASCSVLLVHKTGPHTPA
jgi:nucleotide-binding universal stress UspA family protein